MIPYKFMKLFLILMVCKLAVLNQDALAIDRERLQRITQEVNDRDLSQYISSIERYGLTNYLQGPSLARTVVDSLNSLSVKYTTVYQLKDLINEIVESGFTTVEDNRTGVLMYNLHYALTHVEEKGFGSAKIGRWQFKYMKGECNQLTHVFYTTISHATQKFTFGFVASVAGGYVDPELLKGNDLQSGCT